MPLGFDTTNVVDSFEKRAIRLPKPHIFFICHLQKPLKGKAANQNTGAVNHNGKAAFSQQTAACRHVCSRQGVKKGDPLADLPLI